MYKYANTTNVDRVYGSKQRMNREQGNGSPWYHIPLDEPTPQITQSTERVHVSVTGRVAAQRGYITIIEKD